MTKLKLPTIPISPKFNHENFSDTDQELTKYYSSSQTKQILRINGRKLTEMILSRPAGATGVGALG